MTDRLALTQQPYHPDLLRQPAISASDPIGDRRRAALLWNTFRTLESTAPAFWLRRLIARLGGLRDGVAFAPHTVQVRCWEDLPLAPVAMLRRGKRGHVMVDAVVETEDLLLAICAPALPSLAMTLLADTSAPGLLEVVESTSWRAGSRFAFVAVLLPPEADETTWSTRVARRAGLVERVVAAGERPIGNLRGIGSLAWGDLVGIFQDVATSPIIGIDERDAASRQLKWMRRSLTTSGDLAIW